MESVTIDHRKHQYILYGLICLIILLLLVVLVTVRGIVISNTTSQAATTAGSITGITTSKGVDKSLFPVDVTTQFNSQNDKNIYLILNLKNIKKTDKIAYIRYFNGHYVDSKFGYPKTDSVSHFVFKWSKSDGNYPTGLYLVKVYLNDQLADSTAFTLQ